MAAPPTLSTDLPPAENPRVDVVPGPKRYASPEQISRWGPRWTPQAINANIAQYALECGWVEGTVWQWSQSQTFEDDMVFHTSLDVLAATLHRSKTLFIHHGHHASPFNPQDSLATAHEVKNVEVCMGHLLEEFRQVRKLQTDKSAYSVGVGMEEHYKLYVGFENAVKERLTAAGLEQAEQSFERLNKDFETTIAIFKGKKEEKVELKAEGQQVTVEEVPVVAA